MIALYSIYPPLAPLGETRGAKVGVSGKVCRDRIPHGSVCLIAEKKMLLGSSSVAGGDLGPQEKTVARPRQINAGQDYGRAQGLEGGQPLPQDEMGGEGGQDRRDVAVHCCAGIPHPLN